MQYHTPISGAIKVNPSDIAIYTFNSPNCVIRPHSLESHFYIRSIHNMLKRLLYKDKGALHDTTFVASVLRKYSSMRHFFCSLTILLPSKISE